MGRATEMTSTMERLVEAFNSRDLLPMDALIAQTGKSISGCLTANGSLVA